MPKRSGMKDRWDLAKGMMLMGRDLPNLLPRAKTSPDTMLRRRARRNGDALAIAYLDERYTWAEVDQRCGRYARWFHSQGVGAGDVVALVMDNRPDYIFTVMGLNRLGAVASLINTNLTGKALAHALQVCAAKKILAGEERLEAVVAVGPELETLSCEKDLFVKLDDGSRSTDGHHVIDGELEEIEDGSAIPLHVPNNSDIFCYIYTSGTTGLPKAAIIRNQRMLAANISFGRLMHRSRVGDVIYVTLPLYHSSGMFLGWGPALTTGAAMALRRKFSASNFWRDVVRYRATSFIYIGELCRYLLQHPVQPEDRQHQLRVGVGNGLRPDIWETFQERFGIPVIREFYGSTEGNTPVANFSGRPGMIGRLPRAQALVRCDLATGEVFRNAEGRCESISIGEVGLLLGRISRVLSFDGYVDRSATEKKVLTDVFEPGDRYFNTGDLIQLHADRWLSFADRAGDTFRWKGENVSTNEVAEILDSIADVEEANVYGVQIPHSDGRAGMAALRVADDFSLAGFGEEVQRQLPGYQRPLFLRLLQEEMRVTGTFKHQKVQYREEGYDRAKVRDPLYVLVKGVYTELDDSLADRIASGELTPG